MRFERQQALGELAEIVSGQSPAGSELTESPVGVPFFQGARDFGVRFPSERIFTTSPKKLAQPGDVLLSVRAPVGRVNRAHRNVAIGRGLFALRGKPGVLLTDYLEYALLAMSSRWGAHESSGSVFSNLSRSNLASVVIELPSIEDQRAIAEVLGALDDRIEWCVNLGEKCSQTQAALFAALQQDATTVRLGDWADLDKGVSYKGEFISRSKFDEPLINLGLFGRSSRVRWENLKRYSGPVKERHKVYSNDVVVCATDMTQDRAVLGSVAIVPKWLAAASITHHLYALRLREGAPFPAWMAGSAISHEPTRRRLAEAANGTTVLALPKDIIEDIEVPVLSGSDLQAADSMFWSLQSLIELHEAEQRRLSQLRDALLPQLVSGELRIADPQRILDQVE